MLPMKSSSARVLNLLREHRLVLLTVTVLTLLLTWPAIVYVFRFDVFWLPGDNFDVYIKYWDVWYGGKLLAGQADRFYTDLMFYPRGVSLNHHPFFIPQIMVVNALNVVLPLSNAISLTYPLITATSAFSAYVYLRWLFNDKRVALFGAVVFGFSPHVAGHPYHPDIAFMATVPLALYSFHRGLRGRRAPWIALAGLLTGLTTVISMYMFVCLMIMLGFYICAFAISRLRDRRFWLDVALLCLAIALSSVWRLYPLMTDSVSIDAAAAWHGEYEIRSDALSYIINYRNPFIGPIAESFAPFPPGGKISTTSYLGVVPLAMVLFGLMSGGARRRMLPWVFLCAVFLLLRLGSHLTVNGVLYPDIALPKYYLDEFLPAVFESFWEVDNFMMGALLPFAVLACYGLAALQKRFASAAKPVFVLALVAIVAAEYWIPVVGRGVSDQEVAFLEWLAQEDETQDIRLINLPMGRRNSKLYNLYQALSGYPHAEGAISRTPESAFDYFRANFLLKAWLDRRPVHCDTPDRDAYLAGLDQLEIDGFSHVVYHRRRQNWAELRDSFAGLSPAYHDDFVSIYRLQDLRESCPRQLNAAQEFGFVYAEALKRSSILGDAPGIVVVFPPSAEANDYFMRYLSVFSEIERTIVTVTSDEQAKIKLQTSLSSDFYSIVDPDPFHAVWLIDDAREFQAERTAAFQDWFAQRYKPCARYDEGERIIVSAYIGVAYPCAAIEARSDVRVRYDSGAELHYASFEALENAIRFYLAWSVSADDALAYSIQLFDEDGAKALQFDHVVLGELMAVHEADASALPGGAYSARMIAYDYETRASRGGLIVDTAERFEREFELGTLELGA